MHRREAFQYHQPLRKLYHKHRKSSHKKRSRENQAAMARVLEESTPPSQDPSEDDPLVSPVDSAKSDASTRELVLERSIFSVMVSNVFMLSYS